MDVGCWWYGGNTRKGGGSLAKQKATPEENRCVPPPPPTTSIHLFDHLKGEGNDWSIECIREKLICSIISTLPPPAHLFYLTVYPLYCDPDNEGHHINVVKFIDFHHHRQNNSLDLRGRSRLWRIIAGRLGSPGIVWSPEFSVGHPVPHLRPRVAPGQGMAQGVRSCSLWHDLDLCAQIWVCLMQHFRTHLGSQSLLNAQYINLPLELWTTTFLLVSRNRSFWGLSLASTEARKFMYLREENISTKQFRLWITAMQPTRW